MIEQDGILPPWQPESHKPVLPFVICTNGEGHYWMGKYFKPSEQQRNILMQTTGNSNDCWQSGTCHGFMDDYTAAKPVAWIEPEKFVPFVKARELHLCKFNSMICTEKDGGLWLSYDNRDYARSLMVNFCPWCGYKDKEHK